MWPRWFPLRRAVLLGAGMILLFWDVREVSLPGASAPAKETPVGQTWGRNDLDRPAQPSSEGSLPLSHPESSRTASSANSAKSANSPPLPPPRRTEAVDRARALAAAPPTASRALALAAGAQQSQAGESWRGRGLGRQVARDAMTPEVHHTRPKPLERKLRRPVPGVEVDQPALPPPPPVDPDAYHDGWFPYERKAGHQIITSHYWHGEDPHPNPRTHTHAHTAPHRHQHTRTHTRTHTHYQPHRHPTAPSDVAIAANAAANRRLSPPPHQLHHMYCSKKCPEP